MKYFVFDLNRVPYEVDYNTFKEYYDKGNYGIRLSRDIIAFCSMENIEKDGIIEHKEYCTSFILFN